jgi:hypothetical protein
VDKQANDPTGHRPHSSLRVRWVEAVEVNGADSTIEEALRAVERLRRPVIELTLTPKPLTTATSPVNGNHALPDEPTQPDEPTLFDGNDELNGEDESVGSAPVAGADTGGSQPGTRRQAKPGGVESVGR